MKLLYTTIIAVVVTVLLAYLAGVFAWAYYAAGPSHYVALVIGSPFVLVSRFYSDLTGAAMALALLIYFAASLLLVIACSRLVRKFRRVSDAGRS